MKSISCTKLIAVLSLAVAVLVGSAGCSAVQSIIKTGDPEFIYINALNYYDQEDWGRATSLLETIEPYYTGSMREDTVLFYKARCKFKVGDFDSATEEFDSFRRRFGRSAFLEDAEGMYTLSYYYLAPNENRDQSMTNMAIMAISEFISRYPNSDKVEMFNDMFDELTMRLESKSFNNALTYYKIGRYKSAIVAFKNALKQYPKSHRREELSYYVVASSFELADNSVLHKKEDRFLQMIDSYYTFISEFPESTRRKEVDTMHKKARAYLDNKDVEVEGIFFEELTKNRRKRRAAQKSEAQATEEESAESAE